MKKKNEKGAIVALVAIMSPALVGGLGLVMDLGFAYVMKRRLQIAADAAAVAAAHEIRRENYSTYRAAALYDSSINGFDDGDGANITVSRPPASGPKSGDSGFVEVTIRDQSPLFFMRLFRTTPLDISARAVAGVQSVSQCAIALNDDDTGAFTVAGSAHVELRNCGIHVNSLDDEAAKGIGGGTVNAKSINVVGDYDGTGFHPTPIAGTYPADDPFAAIEMPTFGGCTHTRKLRIDDSQVLSPGVYCGGIEITSTAVVTLLPGNHIINGGGLTMRGGGRLVGDGVTIFNTGGPGHVYKPIVFLGGAEATLTAPDSGDYKGILFYQDRDVSSTLENTFSGTSGLDINGAMYFPTTPLLFAGDFEGSQFQVALVADTMEFRGNPTFEQMGEAILPTQMSAVRVVE